MPYLLGEVCNAAGCNGFSNLWREKERMAQRTHFHSTKHWCSLVQRPTERSLLSFVFVFANYPTARILGVPSKSDEAEFLEKLYISFKERIGTRRGLNPLLHECETAVLLLSCHVFVSYKSQNKYRHLKNIKLRLMGQITFFNCLRALFVLFDPS